MNSEPIEVQGRVIKASHHGDVYVKDRGRKIVAAFPRGEQLIEENDHLTAICPRKKAEISSMNASMAPSYGPDVDLSWTFIRMSEPQVVRTGLGS